MLDYRLSFDEVKNSNKEIQVLIFSRKYIPTWKENSSRNSQITPYYSRRGIRINDVFRPTASDAYAFVLDNRFSHDTSNNVIKTVEVTLIHNWQQEVKEAQSKDYKVQ